MAGFIPYEKLPKKKRREIDRARRGDWGAINPVTKRPERSDVYRRRQEKLNTQRQTRRYQDDRDGFSVVSA